MGLIRRLIAAWSRTRVRRGSEHRLEAAVVHYGPWRSFGVETAIASPGVVTGLTISVSGIESDHVSGTPETQSGAKPETQNLVQLIYVTPESATSNAWFGTRIKDYI